jgi:hypothetical protein
MIGKISSAVWIASMAVVSNPANNRSLVKTLRAKRVQHRQLSQLHETDFSELLQKVEGSLLPQRDADYGAAGPWRYITTADLLTATQKIVPQLPAALSGVVGIPRSGMLPASALAAWLHLPLYSLTASGIWPVGSGSRGQRLRVNRNEPVLVVDDTVYQGRAMRAARAAVPAGTAIYAAVYVRPGYQDAVDIAAELLPSPHLLEWNLFNSSLLKGLTANPALHGGIAFDLDGVICANNPMPDEAPGYLPWLQSAPPLWLPRSYAVPLIITYRCECHRAVTEDWLQRWKVHWDRLVMAPFADWRQRDRELRSADHKARHFAPSDCALLIESHDDLAQAIHLKTGKPVLAINTKHIYQQLL